MTVSTTWAAISALTSTENGTFTGNIHPEWTIGGKPNGGYLLGMMGRAAVRTGPHPHLIAVSAHYLTPPDPGPCTITATVLRAGRSASQVRVQLAQGDKQCVEALMTTSTLDPDSKPYFDGGVPSVDTASRETSIRLPGITPTGLPVPIFEQVDGRIDPATLGFATGAPTGEAELRGWLALPEDEPFDPLSLVYAVDAFPPATLNVELTGWVPTLELTVYVRALPAPGPVRVLHRAQLIEAQRVDEVTYIFDSDGKLVAHGTQLAGIKLG